MSRPHPVLARRALLTGALGFGTAALVGCGSNAPDPATTPDPGPWSFTDDTGAVIERPSRPVRIAGLTDEIAALWNLGVTPVASFGMQAVADDPQFAGKDLSQVTEVGSTYGEIDLEKLAAARPDLIVTHAYPDGKGKLESLLYGFADAGQLAKAKAIAPVLAIAQQGKVDQVATRQAELAAALGVGADTLSRAAEEFRTAGAALRDAAASGVSVLSIAAYETDGIYVMRAGDDPSFAYYTQDLGLTYPKVAPDIFFWQQLSWEKADTYDPDVILFSTRAMGKADLLKQPTFARLAAAKADQVYPKAFYPTDHVGQAQSMRAITDILTAAKKLG